MNSFSDRVGRNHQKHSASTSNAPF